MASTPPLSPLLKGIASAKGKVKIPLRTLMSKRVKPPKSVNRSVSPFAPKVPKPLA